MRISTGYKTYCAKCKTDWMFTVHGSSGKHQICKLTVWNWNQERRTRTKLQYVVERYKISLRTVIYIVHTELLPTNVVPFNTHAFVHNLKLRKHRSHGVHLVFHYFDTNFSTYIVLKFYYIAASSAVRIAFWLASKAVKYMFGTKFLFVTSINVT